VDRRVTSASAVRFADGPEICRYRHVICRAADKSRVSRNCRAKRTAHGQNPAMMAGQRLRFPARGKERAAVRDPVMVKDGDWAFGWPQVRDDMMAVTGTVPDVRRGHHRCRRVGQVPGQPGRRRAGCRSPPGCNTDREVLSFCSDRPSMRLLAAETAEFPVSYASEEGMPFVRREPEDRPC
jgi:hypothetical protein